MSFLAPAYFVAALAIASVVFALHFIVTRQPPSGPLPTARFVPVARVEVTTLARRPEDLLLLLLRILLVLLVGAAFARPILTPGHKSVARIVLADISRDVKSIAEVRDSVTRIGPDRVFVFDSVVRRLRNDEWGAISSGDGAGHLSSALIAGLRAAADLRSSADSIELVLVSPLAAEEWDASTLAIRAHWPGPIRLVRVKSSRDSIVRVTRVRVRGGDDDPLTIAVGAAGLAGSDSAVRVVRGSTSPSDSIWAASGGTLVRWPADSGPPGWSRAATPDTANAVYASGTAVIYPFPRRWQPGQNAGGVVARWVDGAPAAMERRLGSGCLRDVAIPVPARGDLILRSDFARLLAILLAPCGTTINSPRGSASLAALAGSGPLVTKAMLAAPELRVTPLVPWLLLAALLLALGELLLRRRARRGGEA